MIISPFTNDAFSLTTMTASIQTVPYNPGWVSARGLFQAEGVATNTVLIEALNGTFKLVPTRPRDGPIQLQNRDRPTIRPFAIPHIPLNDYINASEVVGVRAFGSENSLETVKAVRQRREVKMAGSLDMTIEYHRVGAIKGVILDADNSTLFDLYAEFGVSPQPTIDMNLDAASPVLGAIRTKCGTIRRRIQDELGNGTLTGLVALCGSDFFDALVGSEEVRQTYLNTQQAAELRGQPNVYDTFNFGGILWVDYRNGPGTTMIAVDEAYVYPEGVQDMFITRFGPANYLETVGTMGLPRYAKGVIDPWGKRVDLEAQTNPLNLCTRPRATQKLTLT